MTVDDSGVVAMRAATAALAGEDWTSAFERLDAARQAGALDAAGFDALAEAAFGIGRIDDAFTAREQAYAGYDEAGDSIAAGGCAVWLAFAYFATDRPSVGGGWAHRAQRCLEGHDDCAPFGYLLLLGSHQAMAAGELDEAAERAGMALTLGRRLRVADVEAMALQSLAGLLVARGAVSEGLAHYDESMLFAVEGRLTAFALGSVYCGIIAACEDLGDIRRAAEWTEALTRWVEGHPFAVFPGICRVHRATVLQRRGSWPEAEAEARRASVDLAALRMPGTAAAALAEIGDIRRRLGDVEGAEAAFRQAEELGGRPQAGLALLRLSQGRLDAARAIIDRALAETSGNALARAKLLPGATQIAIARGDVEHARTCVEELEATARAFHGPALLAAAATSRGRLHLADGDASTACVTLHRALRLWQELDVPYEAATARLLLGQACRGAGDEDGAKASFAAAAQGFERLGAVLEARRIHDSVHRAPTRPAGLTEREAQVLRLVAAGGSNRDIAGELFLSEKTVARHLSNIFVKIGVSSRSAATAFAFEQGIAGPSKAAPL